MFISLVPVAYTEVDRIHIETEKLLHKIQNCAFKFNSSLVRRQVSKKTIKSMKLGNLDILKDIILFNIDTMLQVPPLFFSERTKYVRFDMLPV